MREEVSLTGMVLRVSPVGEYDKRVVLLTRELGTVTAFARGSRRPGSSLMGCTRPFTFGIFRLYEGRDAYTLAGAEVRQYFDELSSDLEANCYGQYFLEFADYYSRENLEAEAVLLLVYLSLKALLNPRLPNALVRIIFELKLMVLNGEYTAEPEGELSEAARYAWQYILTTPLEKLYTFLLTEEAREELERAVTKNRKRFVDRRFHSLEILSVLHGSFRQEGKERRPEPRVFRKAGSEKCDPASAERD